MQSEGVTFFVPEVFKSETFLWGVSSRKLPELNIHSLVSRDDFYKWLRYLRRCSFKTSSSSSSSVSALKSSF